MLRAQLDHIISQVLDFAPETSDILFVPGKVLQAEIYGKLTDVPIKPDTGPLLPFQTEAVALALMGQNLRVYRDYLERGSADLSYELSGRARFRVNIFSQRGSISIVMRQLSTAVPTLEQLGLPALFKEMAKEKYGMILVTGGTGSGKTTSLAALIDRINELYPVHIVTLEDPVEYLHPHKSGTVNQRELGIDFDEFSSGLRAALRQAPKVVLVGEIRDRETVEIAMSAAETGHLVLGTLHTSDAGQTINRIIGLFELAEEQLVRTRLSESLKFVVGQRLLPKVGGGRVAAFELMRSNLRVRDLIINGETEDKTFYGIIESSSAHGMVTFDQYIYDLFESGKITEETAMLAGTDKAKLSQMLDKLKASRGEKVTDIEGLEFDTDYGG